MTITFAEASIEKLRALAENGDILAMKEIQRRGYTSFDDRLARAESTDGVTDINPWMPERDLIAHQAIGKLGEELSEGAGRCFRSLIQGLNEIDPDTGRTNREELSRELADIMANIQTVKRELDIDYSDERVNNKRAGYAKWFAKLRFLSAR